MSVLVLVPVLNRPRNVAPLVKSFVENRSSTSSLLFLVQENDVAEYREVANHCETINPVHLTVVSSATTSWSQKLNEGYRRSSQEDTRPSWYLLGADDIVFHKGWDDNPALLALMADPKIGVIGTNDMGNPEVIAGNHSTHPLMSRRYVEDSGTQEARGSIAPECYHHNYVDTEIVAIAKSRRAYAHCHESRIEHMHPVWRKGKKDATYTLGQSRFSVDKALFAERKKLYGWP